MRMTDAAYILLAILVGVGSAAQVGMIGALGRQRGVFEATLISMFASIIGLTVFIVLRSLRDEPPHLPAPLDQPLLYGLAAAGSSAGLLIAMRGLQPYLATAGLFGFLYVVSAAFLAPRLGVALYVGAVTAGTLFGSVGLDHVGAFGADVQRLTLLRALGVAALLVGVVLVRSGR